MKMMNEKPLSKVQEENRIKAEREQHISNIPQIESDVNEVALSTAYTLEDTASIAETLSVALMEIEILKAEIAELRGI